MPLNEIHYPDHELRRFRKSTVLLCGLAIFPFVFVIVMSRLNSFGFYLSPLVFIGLCPIGVIGLPFIAYTEIKLIWKYLGGKENSKKLKAICLGISIAGFVAPVALALLIWAYIAITFLQS